MSATGQVCTVLGRDMAPTAAILQPAVPPASAVSEGTIATPAAVVVRLQAALNAEVIEIMSETAIQPQLWGTSVNAPIDLCTSESEEPPILDPTAVIDLTGEDEDEKSARLCSAASIAAAAPCAAGEARTLPCLHQVCNLEICCTVVLSWSSVRSSRLVNI